MKIRLILLLSVLLTVVASDAQVAKKTDEYGNINNENAAARLDNFAIQLQMEPLTNGYIITYGGSKGNSTAKARADFAKNYLVNTRGMMESRIFIIDGGLKAQPSTELWIVPFDASAPTASPTVKPKPVKDKSKSNK
jgi:hypothetical protein